MNVQTFAHQLTRPQFILFGAPEAPRIIKDDSANLISGKAEQGVWLYSDDTQSGSKFGIWDCTAGRFKATMDGFTEFCHILEGEAEIANLADRSTRVVRAGDSFVKSIASVIPKFTMRFRVETVGESSTAIAILT